MFLLLFHTFKLISRYFKFGVWFETACGCGSWQQIVCSPEEAVVLAAHLPSLLLLEPVPSQGEYQQRGDQSESGTG